jgi:LruC domain-containing protein
MKRTFLFAVLMLAAVFSQTLAGAEEYDTTYPGTDAYSTLAFEDNWPMQGDYDLNDLVLSYQVYTHGYTTVIRENDKDKTLYWAETVQIYVMIQGRGASYHSGFGFQLGGTDPTNVYLTGDLKATLSINGGTANPIQPETNNASADLVWILFNDATPYAPVNTLPAGNTFSYFNTESAVTGTTTPGTGAEFILTWNFIVPVDLSTMMAPPYNPFIFRTGERGREVHLPGFQPTDLANTSLMGGGATPNISVDDNTDPLENAQEKHIPAYVTKANAARGVVAGLPWAVNIGTLWNHPREKQSISAVYPHILQWISSGGVDYKDWYKRPLLKTGSLSPYPFNKITYVAF